MFALRALRLLLLCYVVRSSPSNREGWCPGKQGGHNQTSFGECGGGMSGYDPLPQASRHPVMFVPSMIGSNLYRRLHKASEPYPICTTGGGWDRGGDW
eukprot:COSAG02_NODE_216_length_28610_cov_57.176879_11_plen_98_part_00